MKNPFYVTLFHGLWQVIFSSSPFCKDRRFGYALSDCGQNDVRPYPRRQNKDSRHRSDERRQKSLPGRDCRSVPAAVRNICRYCKGFRRLNPCGKAAGRGLFSFGQRIDHRRIGLQLHSRFQPVDKNRRHVGPLLRHPGFLFNDGSQRQQLPPVFKTFRRFCRQASSSVFSIARRARRTMLSRLSPLT